ncbi:hypothetical protein TL16_g01885 [Triparma laevis f. inornata]|uniref:Uncharacterized protein n=2 Tax=Triparma laevis TaxID=1534972 RepID=A0A9W7DUC8_9STRA|nr:hypothetical protein TL16_g01885 [Triparma laevis f. inornata]
MNVMRGDCIWRKEYVKRFRDCVIPKKGVKNLWYINYSKKIVQEKDIIELGRHKIKCTGCTVVGCSFKGNLKNFRDHCKKKHGMKKEELEEFARGASYHRREKRGKGKK